LSCTGINPKTCAGCELATVLHFLSEVAQETMHALIRPPTCQPVDQCCRPLLGGLLGGLPLLLEGGVVCMLAQALRCKQHPQATADLNLGCQKSSVLLKDLHAAPVLKDACIYVAGRQWVQVTGSALAFS
jgi:hypothetical protein